MPRASKAQAEKNRIAVTEASAKLFRERGINGVSVADLMAAAGLTHGGFYGHFKSKDDLAAQACRSAFERSCERWRTRVAECGGGTMARRTLIDGYLSQESKLSAGTACPTAGLAGDVAREDPGAPIRGEFAAGVAQLIAILASVQGAETPAARRSAALGDLAMLTGALLLARATHGAPVSDEFLAAARERLLRVDRPGAR